MAQREPPPRGGTEAASGVPVPTLAEHLRDAVFSTDAAFRIRAWSSGAEDLFGWRADEVLGRPARALLRPEFVDGSRAEVQRALRTQGMWRGRVVKRHKDGRWIPVLNTTLAWRDAAGAVTGYLAVSRDPAAAIRDAAARAERAARRRALAKLALDLTSDAPDEETLRDGIPRRVSALFGDPCLLFVAREAALELAGAHGGAPGMVLAVRAVMEGAPMDGGAVTLPLPSRARRRPGAVAVAPLPGPDGHGGLLALVRPDRPFATAEVELLTAAAREVAPVLATARRHAEREAAHRADLGRMRELELTIEDLESFAHAVSHDLRAPLRSVDGLVEVLLQDAADSLDERAKFHLHRVRLNVNRMARLVEDLLFLSRVTRREMRREPVDLTAMALDVYRELAEPDVSRRVDLAIAPDMGTRGDAGLLRIVLANLIGNAWKFTARTQNARIEIGRGEAGVFFVRDNGAGFDVAHAARLFEPFQRLHRAEEFPGTGIGLATCQRIVRRHGGRIWAEAAVGRGATFFFTLPVSPEAT